MGLIIVSSTIAQEKGKKKRLTREEKQELKLEREAAAIAMTSKLIQDSLFVLEADYLSNSKGQRVPVTSTINFITINKNVAVFQFGSAGAMGHNGFGGVTVTGVVNTYEVSKRKKGGSYYLRTKVSSSIGFFDITFDIGATGYTTSIVSSMKGSRLKYSGNLIPISESTMFKGWSW